MRFGMSGAFLPANMDDFTVEMAKRVRDLGFSGVFTRFRANDPFQTSKAQCQRLRDLLAGEGLRMYQTTGYWQCLIHPDEGQRWQAVHTLQEALRVAGDIGARGIDTGPGSMSPTGPWNPHPDNWNPGSREQLIKSLRECAKAAEDQDVFLSLEGHQLVTLEDADVMREVLDAVGSPYVRCDFDPVNWITLKTVFQTGPAIDQMVDALDHRIVSAHAKDIVIEDRLTLHLETVPAGRGLLDYRTFLRRLEALDPEYPVIVEAAGEKDLPEVSAFLRRTAEEGGIRIIGPQ
ncbi:MAG: sugar phosphate isomerase/epimerase [Candidatus Latescibacteria bacterium]|nr:sugar phosphate isomerase/epimerase [Candidatus Latescibacterota bacterium]